MPKKQDRNLFELANANFGAGRNFLYLTLALGFAALGIPENSFFIIPVTGALALSGAATLYNFGAGCFRNHIAMKDMGC